MGARLAGARGVSDLLLERNQAFRAALLDLQHVTTLLGYLARWRAPAATRRWPRWHDGWAARLRALEERGRAAAVALGADPETRDRARRRQPRWAARGAQLGAAVGHASGEAIDHSPIGRLARRRAT